MFADESNGKFYLNHISKFEFKSNFIVVELEFEPEPRDLGVRACLMLWLSYFRILVPLYKCSSKQCFINSHEKDIYYGELLDEYQ